MLKLMGLNLEWIFFIYLSCGLLGLLGIAWYYDRWDRSRREPLRTSVLFYCVKCEQVYPGKKGQAVAPCQQCGFKNTRLEF